MAQQMGMPGSRCGYFFYGDGFGLFRTTLTGWAETNMNGLAQLLSFVLAAMGLTVLVVWPQGGAGAFLREKLLRKLLPKFARGLLDCYICFGFWAGLLLSVPWWFMYRQPWVWFGCLMLPAVFWLVMGKWK